MEEKIENGFLDEYYTDFYEYVDRNRVFKWMKKPEFQEINKQISDLKLKYPKITAYIDEGEIEELTKEELKALRKVIDLNNKIEGLEEKEIFKLGMKENYIYLKNMDMLNV